MKTIQTIFPHRIELMKSASSFTKIYIDEPNRNKIAYIFVENKTRQTELETALVNKTPFTLSNNESILTTYIGESIETTIFNINKIPNPVKRILQQNGIRTNTTVEAASLRLVINTEHFEAMLNGQLDIPPKYHKLTWFAHYFNTTAITVGKALKELDIRQQSGDPTEKSLLQKLAIPTIIKNKWQQEISIFMYSTDLIDDIEHYFSDNKPTAPPTEMEKMARERTKERQADKKSAELLSINGIDLKKLQHGILGFFFENEMNTHALNAILNNWIETNECKPGIVRLTKKTFAIFKRHQEAILTMHITGQKHPLNTEAYFKNVEATDAIIRMANQQIGQQWGIACKKPKKVNSINITVIGKKPKYITFVGSNPRTAFTREITPEETKVYSKQNKGKETILKSNKLAKNKMQSKKTPILFHKMDTEIYNLISEAVKKAVIH